MINRPNIGVTLNKLGDNPKRENKNIDTKIPIAKEGEEHFIVGGETREAYLREHYHVINAPFLLFFSSLISCSIKPLEIFFIWFWPAAKFFWVPRGREPILSYWKFKLVKEDGGFGDIEEDGRLYANGP